MADDGFRASRRRRRHPTSPKPRSMLIHVAGSGTAETGGVTTGGGGEEFCVGTIGGTITPGGGPKGEPGGRVSAVNSGGIGVASRLSVVIGTGGAMISTSGCAGV